MYHLPPTPAYSPTPYRLPYTIYALFIYHCFLLSWLTLRRGFFLRSFCSFFFDHNYPSLCCSSLHFFFSWIGMSTDGQLVHECFNSPEAPCVNTCDSFTSSLTGPTNVGVDSSVVGVVTTDDNSNFPRFIVATSASLRSHKTSPIWNFFSNFDPVFHPDKWEQTQGTTGMTLAETTAHFQLLNNAQSFLRATL